jgi:hypothetical protein
MNLLDLLGSRYQLMELPLIHSILLAYFHLTERTLVGLQLFDYVLIHSVRIPADSQLSVRIIGDEDLNLNCYSVNLNLQNDANWGRLSVALQQIQFSSYEFQLGHKQSACRKRVTSIFRSIHVANETRNWYNRNSTRNPITFAVVIS